MYTLHNYAVTTMECHEVGAVSVLAGGAGSDPPGRIQAPRAAGGVQRLQSVHPDSAFGSIDVQQQPTATVARATAARWRGARATGWAAAYVVVDAAAAVGVEASDQEVTFVNCLEMGPGVEDAAFGRCKDINDYMVTQPGYRSHVLRRRLDDDVPFGFVNIVRWASMESLAAARDQHFGELARDLPFAPRTSWCRPVPR